MGSASSRRNNIKAKVVVMGVLEKHHVQPTERRESLRNFVKTQKEAKMDFIIEEQDKENSVYAKFSRLRCSIMLTGTESEQSFNRMCHEPREALLQSDSTCHLCQAYIINMSDAYSCRVCPRTYHSKCIEACSDCREGVRNIVSRANTNMGWSCHLCDNISLILTDDEMREVIEDFESVDINQDASITMEEFLNYKKRKSLDNYLSEADVAREKLQFKIMDVDGSGEIDWWEFLNTECSKILARRPKEELVILLRPKEIAEAKGQFGALDEDGNGAVTEVEAKRLYMKWYTKHNANTNQMKAQGFSSPEQYDIINHHAEQQWTDISENSSQEGVVTWKEYLQSQAIYFIYARPNKAIIGSTSPNRT